MGKGKEEREREKGGNERRDGRAKGEGKGRGKVGGKGVRGRGGRKQEEDRGMYKDGNIIHLLLYCTVLTLDHESNSQDFPHFS